LRQGFYLQDPGDPNFDLRVDFRKEIKIKQVFTEANSKEIDKMLIFS
jgi:hypothetical protein